MEAELRNHLEDLARRYAAAKKLELSTVARQAFGDWRFFQRLGESERTSFTVRKYDAAVRWFSVNWPADAVWPEGIARPQGDEAAA